MDDEFFNKYAEAHKEEKGIPGFQMNAPLTTNALLGKIGIELELEPKDRTVLPRDGHLEAIKTPKTGAGWRSIEDGSLRNGGREYIVSAPILKEELKGAVEALWGVFEQGRVQLGNSNRCSTHVHINASGLTINQLTSIVVLWGTFEESIIDWCGEERVKNHFCLSSKDAGSLVGAWDRLLRTGRVDHFDRNLRYSALNVNPIWDRGSIEFRCGPAADTPDIPIKWAGFIHDFVNYAVKTYPNPEQIAHDLSERGGYHIFRDITKGVDTNIGTEIIGNKDPGEFDNLAISGFRNVQKLALGHPWGDWMDLINREYVPNPFAKTGKVRLRRHTIPTTRTLMMNPVTGRVEEVPPARGEIEVGTRVVYATGEARPVGSTGTARAPKVTAGRIEGWFVEWDRSPGSFAHWSGLRSLRRVVDEIEATVAGAGQPAHVLEEDDVAEVETTFERERRIRREHMREQEDDFFRGLERARATVEDVPPTAPIGFGERPVDRW
jgi:Putative amidoligase enzyme.